MSEGTNSSAPNNNTIDTTSTVGSTTTQMITTTVQSTTNTVLSLLSSTTNSTNITDAPPLNKIFLQTAAAQGITGACAFIALIITCHQVSN